MTRKIHTWQRLFIGLTFLVTSAIVVVNNSTQLFQTYKVPLSETTLNYIAFGGLILASVWAIILASIGEFS